MVAEKNTSSNTHVAEGLYILLAEGEDPVDLSTKGVNATLKLLQTDGSLITIDGIKELAGALGPVFKWGQAAYTLVTKFTGGQLGEIKEKLKQILAELTKVEETIRNGFDKLIAHDDALYYREKISSPAQILFDSMERHSSVLDQSVQDKFLQSCKDYPPVDIISRVYDFLKMADNGLMTQLIANKYGYQVYKDWVGMMRSDLIKCASAQLYYDGIIMERDKTASAEDADYLAGKICNIENRFFDIDADRCIRFIASGEAQTLFRQIATEIANSEQANYESGLTHPMMGKLLERWLKANGEQPFTIQSFRGRMNDYDYSPHIDGVVRTADYKIFGNENRMFVIDNIFGKGHENNEEYKYADPRSKRHNSDNINFLVIQPITKEMNDKHIAAVSGATLDQNISAINSTIDSAFHKVHSPDVNWSFLQDVFNKIHNGSSSKPMCIVYSNEQGGSKTKSENKTSKTIFHVSYSGGKRMPFGEDDDEKMEELGDKYFSLDFTRSIRWEMVDIISSKYTKMDFSLVFM